MLPWLPLERRVDWRMWSQGNLAGYAPTWGDMAASDAIGLGGIG